MRDPVRGGTVRAMGKLVTRARKVDPVAVDRVIAAGLVVIAVVAAAGGKHHGPLPLFAAAVTCGTVAWRRRAPAVTTLTGAVGITVFAVSSHSAQLSVEPVAVLLDYYMLGRLSIQRAQPLIDALLLAVPVAAITISPGNNTLPDVAASWAVVVAVPFAAGRAISSRAALTRELQANASRLEREQEERARQAAAEERNRIARELHDVVAHSVSVMVIQTQAARRIAADDPDTARDALRSVQACGRDALTEMRRMIGVLRHGDEQLAGATAPALSQLADLATRARAAGLPVELRIEGEPQPLPAGLELVAFRVVQEALTNAIKHAGPARAVVRVAFTPAELAIDVSDNGRGPTRDGGAGGHGLVGMRERLILYGGELETGRARGGGFRVRARIPLLEAAVP